MKTYSSVGFKSPLIKSFFVFLGVILIGLVSWMVIQFTWMGLLLTALVGYTYRSWSRALLRIRYTFDQEEIRIVLPNRKEMQLERGSIVSVRRLGAEEVGLHSFSLGAWIAGDIHFCITSSDHLVEIELEERRVVLSPRRIDKEIFTFYTQ